MRPTKTGFKDATVWKGYDYEHAKGGKVGDMEAVRGDDGALWSCWTAESVLERLKFLVFGKIWIGVLSERQPPVAISVGRKP